MEVVLDDSTATTRRRNGSGQFSLEEHQEHQEEQYTRQSALFAMKKLSRPGNYNITMPLETCFSFQVPQQDSRQDSPYQEIRKPEPQMKEVHQEASSDYEMMEDGDPPSACQQPRLHEGLHHPEVASFYRDQAGFIVSPRKQSRYALQHRHLHSSSCSPNRYDTCTNRNGNAGYQDTSVFNFVQTALSIAEVEEPVALAPRPTQPQEDEVSPAGTDKSIFQWNGAARMFNRAPPPPSLADPSSPTSTTAGAVDFLREIRPCPSIPIEAEDSNCSSTVVVGNGSSAFVQATRSFSMDQSDSSCLTRVRNTAQAFLPQDYIVPLASGVSTARSSINAMGGNGRALCRSFAWSHDSQDDLRITKRARIGGSVGESLPVYPPSMSASINHETASSPQRSSHDDSNNSHLRLLQQSSSHFYEEDDDQEHRDKPSFSPTMIHWEEKVVDSNDLLNRLQQTGMTEQSQLQQQQQRQQVSASTFFSFSRQGSFPPPIAAAASASQYSFDSIP
jgi:hypothetical protein